MDNQQDPGRRERLESSRRQHGVIAQTLLRMYGQLLDTPVPERIVADAKGTAMDDAFRRDMLAALPPLRAFAISLCGNRDRADDLVQETVKKALAARDSFSPGTNMAAWLFTILRNQFRSDYRRQRREVEDPDGSFQGTLKTPAPQHGRMDLAAFSNALDRLPHDQREALVLVGASGFSYEEASRICGCAVGTIKSRVNRARTRMADLMGITGPADIGPDGPTAGALGS